MIGAQGNEVTYRQTVNPADYLFMLANRFDKQNNAKADRANVKRRLDIMEALGLDRNAIQRESVGNNYELGSDRNRLIGINNANQYKIGTDRNAEQVRRDNMVHAAEMMKIDAAKKGTGASNVYDLKTVTETNKDGTPVQRIIKINKQTGETTPYKGKSNKLKVNYHQGTTKSSLNMPKPTVTDEFNNYIIQRNPNAAAALAGEVDPQAKFRGNTLRNYLAQNNKIRY